MVSAYNLTDLSVFVYINDHDFNMQQDLTVFCFTYLHWSRLCFEFAFKIISADPSGRAVYGRSPAEIVVSNPTGVMDVCLCWVLCVVR